ncbi:hypothetical protein K469DRAFT_524669, partial [Zopfia rhizophila CBS 207.26]
RRLIRKTDLRLLPTLAVIYVFALICGVNLQNAQNAGMDEDLDLSLGHYFLPIPYITFQFPADIVIRKLGPALWLPSLVMAWGGVIT